LAGPVTLTAMKPSYSTALLVGAVTGIVLAVALTLYVGSTGGIPSVDAVVEGSRIVPVFAPPASSLWIMVILTCAIGGFVAATTTRAVARVVAPDVNATSLVVIATLGIVIAPVVGMAVFPLGAIVLGSISEGIVTLSVIQLVALALITGFAAGGFVVWLSYILARPPTPAEDTSIHVDTADRSA
jgi:nitrate reductase NapE component